LTGGGDVPPDLFEKLCDRLVVDEIEEAMNRPPRRELVLRTFPVRGGEEPYEIAEGVVVEDGAIRKKRPGERRTGSIFHFADDGSEATIMMPCPEGESA
jgi:hypothetical protein